MTYVIAGKAHHYFKDGQPTTAEPGDVYEPSPEELAAFPHRFLYVPGGESPPPVREPAAPVVDVSGLTINEALTAVETGGISPADALEQERNGKNRKGLIEALEGMMGNGG